MNPLQILILIIMALFTLYHFWNDIRDTWNTGGKFGEGFVSQSDIINLYGYDMLMDAWRGKNIEGFQEGARTANENRWNMPNHSHYFSGSQGPRGYRGYRGYTGSTGGRGSTGGKGGKGGKGDKGDVGGKGDKGDKVIKVIQVPTVRG